MFDKIFKIMVGYYTNIFSAVFADIVYARTYINIRKETRAYD